MVSVKSMFFLVGSIILVIGRMFLPKSYASFCFQLTVFLWSLHFSGGSICSPSSMCQFLFQNPLYTIPQSKEKRNTYPVKAEDIHSVCFSPVMGMLLRIFRSYQLISKNSKEEKNSGPVKSLSSDQRSLLPFFLWLPVSEICCMRSNHFLCPVNARMLCMGGWGGGGGRQFILFLGLLHYWSVVRHNIVHFKFLISKSPFKFRVWAYYSLLRFIEFPYLKDITTITPPVFPTEK